MQETCNVLEIIEELMDSGHSKDEAMQIAPYYANYTVPSSKELLDD